MNIIIVEDVDSRDGITIGLARNGYYVTTNRVTDEFYKAWYEIKYCSNEEFEEKIKSNEKIYYKLEEEEIIMTNEDNNEVKYNKK